MQIHKININLTSVSTNNPVSDVPCGTCTACCRLLSPHLTPDEISSGKYPISLTMPTSEILSVDPTVGPIVTMFKNKDGGCAMFIDNKCSIYDDRPLACRQFDCRKGHHQKTNKIAKDKFGVIL
jgi:Fe-S-cluster containining protein